jgi:putative ABC transport system permease protein
MLTLVWTNFKRRKGRLALTLLSLLIAFLLFGVLMAARYGFTYQGNHSEASARRLVTVNKVAPFSSLPVAYAGRIAGIPGIQATAYTSAMLGWYQKQPNYVLVMGVPTDSFFAAYPDFSVNAAARRAWSADRTGALVSPQLAKRFGWKIGDHIPIMTQTKQADGGTTWYFNVDGFVTSRDQGSDGGIGRVIAHYKYLDEGRASGKGTVASFTELLSSADSAGTVSTAIDNLFANSAPQTRTATEDALIRSIYAQAGDVAGILVDVSAAVFFSMLLVIGAIVLHSVHERWTEYAVLRALGFRRGSITIIVIAEAVLTCLVGGLLGLGLAALLIQVLRRALVNYMPGMAITGNVALIAVGLMIVFGLVISGLPAWQAARQSVHDALRRA